MSELAATISEDEYASAMRLHDRLSSKVKVGYLLVTIGLLVTALAGSSRVSLISACAMVGAVAGHFAVVLVLAPWRARRTYRKYPLIRKPFFIEPHLSSINFRADDGETRLKWEDIHKWREDDEFVLVYPAPNLFHVVPKKLANVGVDIELLRSSLAKNVGNAT